MIFLMAKLVPNKNLSKKKIDGQKRSDMANLNKIQ